MSSNPQSLDEMLTIPAWVDGVLAPVEKLEVHKRGLKHKAVSVFVMDGGQTLIQRRALSKYHTPGLWANACCTHPDFDEAPEACAARRLREEIGIEGAHFEHIDTVEYRADVGNDLIEHEVVDIYVAEMPMGARIICNPDEVMATRWIRVDRLYSEVLEAPETFTPWLRIYLREHGGRIFGPRAAQKPLEAAT